MKKIIIFMLLHTWLLAGPNNPYINNSGGRIIDIGSTNQITDTSSPLIWDQYPAEYEKIDNIILTKERELSPETPCIIDEKGVSLCPLEARNCTFEQESKNGYSEIHYKTLVVPKICPPKHVRRGDDCYIDENNNGVPDGYSQVVEIKTMWNGFVSRNTITKTYKDRLPGFSYIYTSHYSVHSCDDDYNSFKAKSTTSTNIGYTKTIDSNCWTRRIGGSNVMNTGYMLVYDNPTKEYEEVTRTYSDTNKYGGWDDTLAKEKLIYPSYIPQGDYKFKVENGYYYYYIKASCEKGFNLNQNGECVIDYAFYEYKCESEKNEYDKDWYPVDAGVDCNGYCPGGPSQACKCNEELPPEGNCVRNHYGCPSDLTQKCAATQNDLECPDGLIYINNRCEREEKFCGENRYNINKNICEKENAYPKKCVNDGDVYNSSKNICESSQKICDKGKYSNVLEKCVSEVQIECEKAGYTYDEKLNMCENKDIDPCPTDNFTLVDGKCVSSYTVCSEGMVYNQEENRCVANPCKEHTNNTTRKRCEKSLSNMCDGVVTADGSCIPNSIHN